MPPVFVSRPLLVLRILRSFTDFLHVPFTFAMYINAGSTLQTFVGSLIASALQDGWNNSVSSAEFQGYGTDNDCDLSSFTPSFPSNQTQLTVPSTSEPKFIGLAFGVQNYTCSSSNTYT